VSGNERACEKRTTGKTKKNNSICSVLACFFFLAHVAISILFGLIGSFGRQLNIASVGGVFLRMLLQCAS
jgi:hypothetical protein